MDNNPALFISFCYLVNQYVFVEHVLMPGTFLGSGVQQ